MLKSSGVGARNETLQKRRKVILFLTDGKPTERTSKEILDVFYEEKESLNTATSKDAVIFAYGIGNSDFSLLKRIADDTEAEGTKVASYFNPLMASVAFSILLWLTPDDFTSQWETSWQPEG